MQTKRFSNSQISFIELTKIFKIQIPILQRDYVQGRTNEVTIDIRKNFVKDLVEHISNPTDKLLPLDFIYGYAEEEFGKYDREVSKNNIENLLDTIRKHSSTENFDIQFSISDKKNIAKNLFIPLDGQQRLTTLFLLHFYVSLQSNKEGLGLLKNKLTYKTRKSSDIFCEQLLLNALKLDSTLPISDAIQDSNWFLINWKKDPTVEGMLVMLDEIEKKYKSFESESKRLEISFQQLFISPKVVFDFLDMNEQGIPDDIYLKMNSTGKHLSDYDNFKSWFIPRVEELLEEDITLKNNLIFEDWKNKLDQDWYNVFWSADPIHTDSKIFAFIKSIFSFYILIDVEKDEKTIKKLFDHLNSNEYISISFFEEHNLINSFNVNLLFTLFHELSEESSNTVLEVNSVWNESFSDGSNFKDRIINNLAELSLLDKTFIFSTFLLTIKTKGGCDFDLHNWLRIFRNIIYNTRIDDFSRFITPIYTLLKFIDNPNFSQIDQEKWIEFFDVKQVLEEFEKDQLYLNQANKLALEKAENHHYLYGQIGFLINWSKNSENEFQLETFEFICSRFFNLFSKLNLESPKFLIQCSLLSINDTWMPDKNSNRYSFCKNTFNTARERDENWRVVFNREGSEILNLVKNYECTSEILEELISQKSNNDIKGWSSYIINDPLIISKCGQRLINWGDKGNFIRLLDKTKLSGYHVELRTWVLFNKLKNKFSIPDDEIKYYSVNSGDQDCRLNLKEKNIYIRFDRSDYKLVYEKYSEDDQSYELIDDNIDLENDILDFINSFNLLIV